MAVSVSGNVTAKSAGQFPGATSGPFPSFCRLLRAASLNLQIAGFAERWRCSRQEELTAVFRACLSAMKQSRSTEDLFDRVRDALEAADGAKRFRKRDG
jgi:hypothetical protein